MSKENLKRLNKELEDTLKKSGVETALLYEPISDEYWSLENRIAFCNIEPYNLDFGWPKGIHTIDESVFEDGWIKNKTVGFCAKFAYVYYKTLHGIKVSEDEVRYGLNSVDLIREIRKTAYFNIKPSFSNTIREDKTGVYELFNKQYFDFVKNYIKELQPTVLVVGGRDPLNLINEAFDNLNIVYNGIPVFVNNKKICIQSIKHPSARGVGYKYLFEKVEKLIAFSKVQQEKNWWG